LTLFATSRVASPLFFASVILSVAVTLISLCSLPVLVQAMRCG
jgi:hypothetical protein